MIGTVVNSAQADIGFTVQDLIHGQFYTIHRSSGTLPGFHPFKNVTGWSRRGRPMVMACPIPDWGLSGATTTTFPRSLTASTRLRIPGAIIPSSLVIRITGKSLFFDLDIVIKGLQKYYFFSPVPEIRFPVVFLKICCFLGRLRYLCSRLKIPIWQDN